MEERIFGDREKAMEDAYFRDQNAKLLDKLRQRADLDEIAQALGEKLQVDNPDLLERVRLLGLKPETAPALLLAPLVQVAWAEGEVTKKEADAVLRLIQQRGVEADTPAYGQIIKWLENRPSDELFDTAVEVLKYGFSVLPDAEKEDRIKKIVEACNEVAEASGGGLVKVLGLGSGVSGIEAETLDTITATLRA